MRREEFPIAGAGLVLIVAACASGAGPTPQIIYVTPAPTPIIIYVTPAPTPTTADVTPSPEPTTELTAAPTSRPTRRPRPSPTANAVPSPSPSETPAPPMGFKWAVANDGIQFAVPESWSVELDSTGAVLTASAPVGGTVVRLIRRSGALSGRSLQSYADSWTEIIRTELQTDRISLEQATLAGSPAFVHRAVTAVGGYQVFMVFHLDFPPGSGDALDFSAKWEGMDADPALDDVFDTFHFPS